jgi:Zn finger protein HypA/HybF involved in hydrogenase expression
MRIEKYDLFDFLVTKTETSLYIRNQTTEITYIKCPCCGTEVQKKDNYFYDFICQNCSLNFDIEGSKVKIWRDQLSAKINLEKKQTIEFIDGKIIADVLSINSGLTIV